MTNDEKSSQMANVATWGMIVAVSLGVLVIYLKSIGVRAIGPIPTLILPLSAFVARSWGIAYFAPERLAKKQRGMAVLVTLVSVVAVAIAAARI